MLFRTKLSKSINLALLATASSSMFAISGVHAVEESAANIERISITGSRIKRADMESASPVTVIDASAIASSGVVSIDGLLQGLTAAGGAMTNPGVNNGSGGNARINLRGLGEERTLVLINGRRMIASGTGAASTVDLNTIPVSMIERIEVLKDGASAVYGTDAVSGVVNVILKRDFDGFAANVQSGISSEGDAEEYSFDFTLGNTFEKGNVVMGVQYTDRGDASQADRGFSECPIAETEDASALFCAGSSYAEGGHIWGDIHHGFRQLAGPDDKYVIGDSGFYGEYIDSGKVDDDGNPVKKYQPFDENNQAADLSGRGNNYHDFVSSGDNNDRFDFAKDSFLSTPMQRLNLSLSANYEINDSMLFFTETTYTKRWSDQQMAPQPIWNGESWVYNPIGGTGVDGVAGWMTNELTPWVQTGEKLDYGRRMIDTGTRNFTQNVDTVRVVFGLEGDINDEWFWEVSFNKGKNDSVDTLANLHNIGAINEAVLASDFDPFLQTSWQGSSIAPFIYTEVNTGGSEMSVFSAAISGDIYELPAGTVAFASGYEFRRESAFFTPDSLTAQGLANDPRVEPTSGSFEVEELYAEFVVPLLTNQFLAKDLELSAAARYFNYSSFGDDITWKLGLTWRVTDEFMLRSVRSTAYRAPTVDELYGGNSPSFDQISHAATSQDQAEVTVGGNQFLTPEEADILTFGFVYEPSRLEGLSLTFDYYDIAIRNAINEVDPNYIANQCLGSDGSKINSGTALCQAANIAIDGTGRITFANGLQNLGGEDTSGIDINVNYNFVALGLDWNVSWDTSKLIDFKRFDQDGNVVDYKGYVTGNEGSFAELKTNIGLTVKADDWTASHDIRYIDGLDSFACSSDPSACYAPTVGTVIYHDISGSYYLNDEITISGGINNLFDKAAPYFTGNNDSNTDPYTYDVIGRFFYAKVGIKF